MDNQLKKAGPYHVSATFFADDAADISKSGKHAMRQGRTSDREADADSMSATVCDTHAVRTEEGFCAGTRILTLDGEMPVGHLTAGDRIITRDSGVATLVAVTAVARKLALVRIKAGSLGHTRPDIDMVLPPATRIHIRDWRAEALFGSATAMIPAERLIDGEFIAAVASEKVVVHRLAFDAPHVLYADGLEVAVG